MDASELEEAIWDLETIRVVIRDTSNARLSCYPYMNAANQNWTLQRWLSNRVEPQLNNQDVVIVDGYGNIPVRQTKLGTVRSSYNR